MELTIWKIMGGFLIALALVAIIGLTIQFGWQFWGMILAIVLIFGMLYIGLILWKRK